MKKNHFEFYCGEFISYSYHSLLRPFSKNLSIYVGGLQMAFGHVWRHYIDGEFAIDKTKLSNKNHSIIHATWIFIEQSSNCQQIFCIMSHKNCRKLNTLLREATNKLECVIIFRSHTGKEQSYPQCGMFPYVK